MKFGSITNCFNEEDIIGRCLDLLDVDMKVVVISNRTYQGNRIPHDRSEQIALKKGAIVIKCDTSNQAEMRNLGLSLLEGAGMDYSFIVDSDEWYENIGKFKLYISEHPSDYYRAKTIHLFKKPNYKAIDRYDQGTIICMKSKKRFPLNRPRDVRPDDKMGSISLIPFNGIYHFSWVKTPEKIKEKLANFSHAKEVRENWFEDVWMKFNPKMTDFGATNAKDFERCEVIKLPEIIKKKVPKNLW